MYFFELNNGNPEQLYLISREEEVTYQEAKERTMKIGQAMKPRTLCFLLCENTIGSVLGYMACLQRRVVPLLLDANMDQELLEMLVKTYDPDYIFRGDTLYPRNKNVRTTLYEDLAVLLTTSGSTGSPKLVRQSYENIQSNTEAIVEYLKLDQRERPVTTLPMNYTYGLSVIQSHTQCGATILLTKDTVLEQGFWDFFKKQKGTSIAGVPFTYEMLKKLRFFDMELPSLKTMTQAGGKLSSELQIEYGTYAREHGKRFVVMYGQTEATARMSYLPPEDVVRKAGSIGVVIPGGRFSIVEGELVYEGKNVTLGYATCKDDLAKGNERNGTLYTGDMARIDEDGYYYIVGRKKRFLKILGSRVNLDEVEQILKNHFKSTIFACTGVDDHLSIFMEKGTGLFIEDVVDYISKKTKLNYGVFQVKEILKIPVNASGKILYQQLEEM